MNGIKAISQEDLAMVACAVSTFHEESRHHLDAATAARLGDIAEMLLGIADPADVAAFRRKLDGGGV